MPRSINSQPIKLPKDFVSESDPSFPSSEFCHIPGQPSAIRFFDPNSLEDFESVSEIVSNKQVKAWMDDAGKLSRSDFRYWAGIHTYDSYLFAVHDTRVPEQDFNIVKGFVNIYSERAEKFRIKRMIKAGFLSKSTKNKHILEVSFAGRPQASGEITGSGLMGSALRVSCLQVKALLGNPKLSDLIIFAFIDPKNVASLKTVESAAFVKKGEMKYDSNSDETSLLYFLSWSLLNKKIKNNLYKINLLNYPQITDSHCGPAVTQNLLAFNKIKVSQDDIVNAANAQDTIIEHGMRPSQIADAVSRLAPNLQTLFKQNTTSRDLKTLIHDFRIPVAINWQGLFYDTVAEERKFSRYDDHGHYSIVIDIDTKKDEITIADPYSEYYKKPRTFSYRWFKSRWWDTDKLINEQTGEVNILSTKKLIFVVIPKNLKLPDSIRLES